MIYKNKKINSAFTLIEMLIVISLIGILAALALISFASSQKQARDTQRKSDLRQYQTAIESFASRNDGLYPSYTSNTAADGALCSDLDVGNCPSDPKDDNPFIYRYISDGSGSGDVNATTYALWTALEAKADTTYWVVCSTGLVGESPDDPTSGTICPL